MKKVWLYVLGGVGLLLLCQRAISCGTDLINQPSDVDFYSGIALVVVVGLAAASLLFVVLRRAFK